MARQALEDFCKQRGWEPPVYINLHAAASPGHQPHQWWAWAEQTASPYWKTLRCRDAEGHPCYRGDKCVFAHTDAEVRPKPPKPTAEDTFFLYEVCVRADHATVRSRGDEVTHHKSFAKESACQKLLHRLLDELESLPQGGNAPPPPRKPAPAPAPLGRSALPRLDGGTARAIEDWLLGIHAEPQRFVLCEMAADFEKWLKTLGSMLAAQHPEWMAAVRASAPGSFRGFLLEHGRIRADARARAAAAAGQGAGLRSPEGGEERAQRVFAFLTAPFTGKRVSYARRAGESVHPEVVDALSTGAAARDGLPLSSLQGTLDAYFKRPPYNGTAKVKMLFLAIYIAQFADELELQFLEGNPERPSRARLRRPGEGASAFGGSQGGGGTAAAYAYDDDGWGAEEAPPPPPPPLPPDEHAADDASEDLWATPTGGLAHAAPPPPVDAYLGEGAGPSDAPPPPPPPPGYALLGVEQLRARVAELEGQLEELREVEEFSLCQMCLKVPRDAIVLPCMDFLYCSRCLHGARVVSRLSAEGERCPACKGPVAGVLECRLTA